MASETQSEKSAAAARIKAYIAAHLQEPITASDVAKAAGYSQYHAARIFKEETGLSPFEYIRRQRLTASAHALRASDQKVLNIALDFVFSSHEGFTRAFSQTALASRQRSTKTARSLKAGSSPAVILTAPNQSRRKRRWSKQRLSLPRSSSARRAS